MRLPKYMIFHMRRFTKNTFFVEKNPTLGKFHVFLIEYAYKDPRGNSPIVRAFGCAV
jgi:U4/U6.U5 tri-snRNP-associated protein 2